MTTTPDVLARLKSAVQDALRGIECAYAYTSPRVVPDGQGGAWVELHDVPLGGTYSQETTFVIFLLPFNLPGSDIYPLFVRSDLTRGDGQSLGPAFQSTQLSWPGEAVQRPVVQVSRRTRGEFASQSAAQKVEKVIDWVRRQ